MNNGNYTAKLVCGLAATRGGANPMGFFSLVFSSQNLVTAGFFLFLAVFLIDPNVCTTNMPEYNEVRAMILFIKGKCEGKH